MGDLRLVPVSFADACGFVKLWHRHLAPPVGCKFVVGVADKADVLRGVVIAGRPVARSYDNGTTLEVTHRADRVRTVAPMASHGRCSRSGRLRVGRTGQMHELIKRARRDDRAGLPREGGHQ